jgi:hypothetical protein
MLNAKFGALPLTHVGNISTAQSTGGRKRLAFYGARVKVRNSAPYNLLLMAVPYADDLPEETTLAESQWVTVYLRSYYDLKKLAGQLPLEWQKLADSPLHELPDVQLSAGLWLQEVVEKTARGQRNKFYTFQDASHGDYVVSVETRAKDIQYGTNLKSEYEFDLLLGFNELDVAIERLA